MAGTASLNLLSMVVGSAGGILLARSLGPSARGELAVILQWPAVAGSLASLGITQSTCYWISKRRDEAAMIIRSAARAAIGTGCIVAVAGLGLARLISDEPRVERGLLLLFILSPAFISGGVWMSALQGLNIQRWNVARAVQPLFYFAAVLGLWIAGSLTLETAVATFGLSVLVQAIVTRRQAQRLAPASGKRHGGDLRRLYGYGWKVWLSSIPQIVNVRVDVLVLSLVASVSTGQLGNYAVAASLSWMALPVSIAFGSVAFPRIAASTPAAAARIEVLSITGAALTATATVGVLAAGAPFVVPTLFGSGYEDAVPCLWILAPGTICLAMNRVLTDLLRGRGRPLFTSIGEGIGALATGGLLLLLVPRFGIRGAAVASSGAYALVTVLLLVGLRRARDAASDALQGSAA